MAPRSIRTVDIARMLGVHPNTIRKYEENGYLPPIPRSANGYRLYSRMHVEQARLVHLALTWPYIGSKGTLLLLVSNASEGNWGMAMERAFAYLATVRIERTYAESAVEFLERWAGGYLIESRQERVTISAAAQHLNITVDMLRNWERNGLIDVPRDEQQYRMYGTDEFGRLRVIRMLLTSGYSLMSIRRMLGRFDAGHTDNLRTALDMTGDDELRSAADRWLASLMELESRAQQMIHQIGHMIELSHADRRR